MRAILPFRLHWALWILLLLAGCAGVPQSARLLANRPGDLPTRVELSKVPFYAQDAWQCGPAALATVLAHAGVAVRPEQLTPQVYLPRRQGSLQAELLAATRRYGLLAYPLRPELGAALHELAAGNPVLVLQNMRWAFWPQWHYAVLVGYDLAAGTVLLRSGDQERYLMSLGDFERSWADGGYWAVLALPPGRLPSGAEEGRYLAAAAALERLRPEAARDAYRAALRRWPQSLGAELGLGNVAYTLHEPAQAEAAWRDAVAQHPDAADAWNNLAQLLYELGCPAEALAAARRAVALGGPHRRAYLATLEEINGTAAEPSSCLDDSSLSGYGIFCLH